MMTQNTDKKRGQIQMFCMDDMVPQDHLLQMIDKAINWNFIYDLVADRYSPDNGRPSMAPQSCDKTAIHPVPVWHQKHATDRKGQKDHQGTPLTKAEAIEKIKSGAFRHVITEIGKLSPKSYLTKYVTVLIWHRPSLNFISTQMNPEELTFRLNIAVMPPMALL